ncbi:MAG: zinc-dependent alcohol dehydrogenase family protein [Pseudomonadota bacterium]|uniref:zinc-dependent alcohol dehydrogenase family protein n=1 Tax=Halomonas sp. DP8Y7-1 TaxID=2859078 RepID=UPI001C98DC02|nr:zinc-dependent alcohol dehydrogenase family protein [Halomonas sp. DP8Y7-1]MBY6031525.1 zinc-dependent alcohol dehydrogenase family protein [Halomonas sp. DP8Y7-1]MED5295906.1 zinc-dependent alcohol dehydrogenase family protein [Pseudomonadota bacterium]MEE3214049.1 zinc-dependent alcohol dehydrogenase family protein [Pseudomonadota bacterium]
MRAVVIEKFQQLPSVRVVKDPAPEPHGVVVKVEAAGLCRSDWHGWMGHDADITLPHVPGHEMAGVVVAAGKDVTQWKEGDRVTVPFVSGCGRCHECRAGHQQVCHSQFQPGFTHWGAFAEYTSLHHADLNLVALPEDMSFSTAASLGCRFATAFRAVVDQGRVSAGAWVSVHGCGGVGLSAIMIASALGARVIAIDITDGALAMAKKLGAVATINASQRSDVVEAIQDISAGGAHLSFDALGTQVTCSNSIMGLRTRGRHVQIGLLAGEHRAPAIPMHKVIAEELELIGSHGMQAHRYDAMLGMIQQGQLNPSLLVGDRITLDDTPARLTSMDQFKGVGATVIDRF